MTTTTGEGRTLQLQKSLHDLKNTAQLIANRAAIIEDRVLMTASSTMIKQVNTIASLIRMQEAERAIVDKNAS